MAAGKAWHRSLAGRFNLLVVASILVTSIGLTAFYVHTEKSHRFRDLIDHGLVLAAMMAQNGQYGVYTRDPQSLQAILVSLESDPEIAYAAFLGMDRKEILSRSRRPVEIVEEDGPTPGQAPAGNATVRTVRDAAGRSYVDILAPVMSQASAGAEGFLFAVESTPKVIGYVRVGLTREIIDREIAQYLASILGTTLLLIVLALVPTLLTTRKITGPIRELVSFTRSVSEEKLSDRIEIRGTGEIAELGVSFNQMLARLEGSRAELEERSEALRAAHEQLSLLLESLPVVVYTCEPSGKFPATYISPNTMEVTGFRPEEFLSEPEFWLRRIHPEDAPRVLSVLQGILDRGQHEHEYRWQVADGSYRWFRDALRVVRDPDGGVRHIVGVWENVSRSHEEAEARALLFMAVEQAEESILITDPDGTIRYVNPAFERIYGYTREEVLGKTPRTFRSGHHDAEFYREMWETISGGEVWTGSFVNRRKNGETFHETAVISPVRNREGRIVQYVAVKRDVTNELQLEEQLRQSQKMEAIGKLAGGIAHDFNNLLTAITGYGEILQGRVSEDDPSRKEIEGILGAGTRAAALTRQLLAFSRKQMLQPKVLDLNRVVSGMGGMLRRLIGEDLELVVALAEDLWKVRVDPGQVGQVIMNLSVNARDAMEGGGKLTIETANVTVDRSYAMRRPEVEPGEYAMVAVTDTGCGMDEETLARVFEPFFTTKPQGKGTGLGLSTVYGIVKQSRGYIWAYSEVGRGSTFKVYFPRVMDPAAPESGDGAAPSRGRRGTETVLLAEDEPLVRDLVRSVLEHRGYTVVAAGDGVEALETAASRSGPIHLLITDVVMPGMGGRDLAKRIGERFPGIRVLYMSGYTERGIVRQGELDPGSAFLQKPFRVEDLARKVREVLDAGG